MKLICRRHAARRLGFWSAVVALALAIPLAVPVTRADDFVVGKIMGPRNTKKLKPKVRDGFEKVLVELGHTAVPYAQYVEVGKGLGIKPKQALMADSVEMIAGEMNVRGIVYASMRFVQKKRLTRLWVTFVDAHGAKVKEERYDFRGRADVSEEVLLAFKEDLAGILSDLEAPAKVEEAEEVAAPGPAEEAPPAQEEQAPSPVEEAPQVEPAAVPASEQVEDRLFGRFYLGFGGDILYSNMSWRGRLSRSAMLLLGHVQLGAAITREKVVFELGAKFGYGVSGSNSWPDELGYDDGVIRWNHMSFTLVSRLMFPVIKQVLYLGAELEGGVDKSDDIWGRGALRLAASLIVGRYFEIRLLPFGAEMLQEIGLTWFMSGYSGSAALVFRFL